MSEYYLKVLEHHNQVETGHTDLIYLAAVYGIKGHNTALFMDTLRDICVRAAEHDPYYIEHSFNDFLNTAYRISGTELEYFPTED
jgi:hypothetical protein